MSNHFDKITEKLGVNLLFACFIFMKRIFGFTSIIITKFQNHTSKSFSLIDNFNFRT